MTPAYANIRFKNEGKITYADHFSHLVTVALNSFCTGTKQSSAN